MIVSPCVSCAAYVYGQSRYIEKMLSHDPDERPTVKDVLYGELFRSKDQVPVSRVVPCSRYETVQYSQQVYQYTQRAHVKLDIPLVMRSLPVDNRGSEAVTEH